MKKLTTILLALPLLLNSQVPYMVKDITAGSGSTTFKGYHVLPNNTLLFGTGQGTVNSNGVWSSDGTTPGTFKLRQVVGGDWFTYYNSKAYFSSNNTGYALWKTDGTVAGTDSIPVSGLTAVSSAQVVNNLLVMIANTTGTLSELWRSDGTVAGTYSLASALGSVKSLTVVNNIAYYMANTAANGTELWRSDGTTGGTYLLKDIWTGTGSSFTFNPILGVYNNSIFFLANNGSTGAELWKSDGTTAGTILLADIFPGTGSSNVTKLKVGNNGVYFVANNQTNGNELWFSDGTTTNTQMIKDVATGTASAIPDAFVFDGNYAYYSYNLLAGGFICRSNGTSAGTTSISTLPSNTGSITPNSHIVDLELHVYNNFVYYLVKNSYPVSLSMNYDTLYFYKVDLTLNNKSLVGKMNHDFIQGSGDIFSYYYAVWTVQGPHFLYAFKTTSGSSEEFSLAIFNASTLQHKFFYKLNKDMPPFPLKYRVFNNKMYFPFVKQDNEPGYIDFATDSVYLLKDITSGGTSFKCSQPVSTWNHDLFRYNNKSYFFANEPGFGIELFETDYTPAGTKRVKDIYPGANNFDNNNPQNNCTSQKFLVIETPNNLFFGADDGANGFELWTFLTSVPTNTVGIEESNKEDFTTVYPNPASNKVTVNSSLQLREINVLNALGAVVLNVPLHNTTKAEVSLNELPVGVYLLQIQTGAGITTKKIIKQN